MKILVDVNASGVVAQWLQERDHDVALVAARNERMSDDDILRWAVQEQRIIITTDQDFEEMVWREQRTHCGILRLENLPRAERLVLLEDTLKQYGNDLESGAIIIALSRKTRIRRAFGR